MSEYGFHQGAAHPNEGHECLCAHLELVPNNHLFYLATLFYSCPKEFFPNLSFFYVERSLGGLVLHTPELCTNSPPIPTK